MSEEKKKKNFKKKLIIGVACIFRDKKVLIQTRPKGKSFAGKWEFPGGKVEKGESDRSCVEREIYEELGIKITVGEMFFKDIHHFEKVILILKFHKCELVSGEPTPQENQEMKWVGIDDFAEIKFLPTNKPILKKLKEIAELN